MLLLGQAAKAAGGDGGEWVGALIVLFIILAMIGGFIDWLNKPRGWDIDHQGKTKIRPH